MYHSIHRRDSKMDGRNLVDLGTLTCYQYICVYFLDVGKELHHIMGLKASFSDGLKEWCAVACCTSAHQ